jgi:precorrin-2 dehydrogenase/sirohydrochlorin ferrochelatase
MELVQAGRVDWYPRMADRRDTADAFLAVAATSSEETNRDVASWCRKAGILCNQAADAHEGDVQFPMQKQFGPITVAVQSGDAGPLISRMVLEWIADNFDSDILRLSEIASEIRRELGKSISSQPQRREALRSVLQNEKVLALVRENRMREARDEAMKCISTLLG